jgi:hypothetical protein
MTAPDVPNCPTVPAILGTLEFNRLSEANCCSTSFRATALALQSDESGYRAVRLINVVERSMPQVLASKVRSTEVTKPTLCLMDSRAV